MRVEFWGVFMILTVAQLAERIGAELRGEGSGLISGVAAIEAAGENDVTFVMSGRGYGGDSKGPVGSKHRREAEKTEAGAIIVARPIEALKKAQLIVKNMDAGLIEALRIFAPDLKPVEAGIDPAAKIGQDVRIADSAAVGAFAVIDDGVQVGESTVIGSGCKIGWNTRVGANCRFDSNVVIYHDCVIGNNVIIQANSTIGSTGFGYSFIDGSHQLVPHNGGVVIEDFVEIGANCCIDRAKFGNTTIGAGTKIDNLVQIAHNVVVGKCCLIAGQVGISGSCRLCDGVVLGGQAGLADNVEVGKGTLVGGGSAVTHSIPAGQQIFGTPAMERNKAWRIIALTRRLPKLVEQVKQLSDRIEGFEASKDDKE